MIYLGPVKDRQRIESLFSNKNIPFGEFSQCVAADNKGDELGFCLFDLDNEKMVVRYIEPLGDISLADGILRSTLHVAAERSVMKAYYAETVPENFLSKIGFIKDAEEKSLDIDKLFQSCCDCK